MKENIEKDIQTLIVTNNYCLLTEIGILIRDLNKLYGHKVENKDVIDSLKSIILKLQSKLCIFILTSGGKRPVLRQWCLNPKEREGKN